MPKLNILKFLILILIAFGAVIFTTNKTLAQQVTETVKPFTEAIKEFVDNNFRTQTDKLSQITTITDSLNSLETIQLTDIKTGVEKYNQDQFDLFGATDLTESDQSLEKSKQSILLAATKYDYFLEATLTTLKSISSQLEELKTFGYNAEKTENDINDLIAQTTVIKSKIEGLKFAHQELDAKRIEAPEAIKESITLSNEIKNEFGLVFEKVRVLINNVTAK